MAARIETIPLGSFAAKLELSTLRLAVASRSAPGMESETDWPDR